MTVPADHMVGSYRRMPELCTGIDTRPTGQLDKRHKLQKNLLKLLPWKKPKKLKNRKATAKKTWIFKADNVRDFAWTSTRKFVWDAMPAYVEGKKVMCMSFYGKEAYSLYRKFSTKAVAHTIKTYSKFTIPYPYPVAQSVEAANGMEYPMICFNYGRTEKDGTYSEATKYGMLGVIIHEVGHNFFP